MITIKSIAKHFDITPSAVSKALNGLPGVSDRLRRQIADYAAENNYIPNAYAKGLKGSAMKVFGVIISDNTNPSFSLIIKGIEKETEKHGYNIILCNSNEDWRQEEKQLRMLIQKRVDGMMIVPSAGRGEEAMRRFDILRQSAIPYVFISRSVDCFDCDTVMTDNVHGAGMAAEYLVKRGHNRVLHITTSRDISSASERVYGFTMAMRKAGRKISDADIHYVDDIDWDKCEEDLWRIISENRDATAVFVFNDILAFHLIRVLVTHGVRVPDDIAVIGFDNNTFGEMSMVPLTTVPQESEYLGSTAVELLLERIQHGRKEPVHKVIVPGGVVKRGSA